MYIINKLYTCKNKQIKNYLYLCACVRARARARARVCVCVCRNTFIVIYIYVSGHNKSSFVYIDMTM